jgi:predicted DNA binding protein
MDKICIDYFLRFRVATDTLFLPEMTNHHEGPFTLADLTDKQREAIQLRYHYDFVDLGYNK